MNIDYWKPVIRQSLARVKHGCSYERQKHQLQGYQDNEWVVKGVKDQQLAMSTSLNHLHKSIRRCHQIASIPKEKECCQFKMGRSFSGRKQMKGSRINKIFIQYESLVATWILFPRAMSACCWDITTLLLKLKRLRLLPFVRGRP